MKEQIEIRRKLGLNILYKSPVQFIPVTLHDKHEEERVTMTSSSARKEQFAKRNRSDDVTRIASRI